MDLNKDILQLTCELYQNLNLRRSDIQFIIDIFQKFITNSYSPFLFQKLHESLYNGISDEVYAEIKKTFKNYADPFQSYNTESKRQKVYKDLGLFIEPVTCVLEQKPSISKSGNQVSINYKEFSVIHVPMKESLTKLLEIDGLFESMTSYIEFVQSNEHVQMNFVQSPLWKEQCRYFEKDGIALPLLGYFDDIETGNALGSHAGKNEVGAVYATIPCFPPNFASKLNSIVLCSLFYSKQRNLYGNKRIFQPFIDDLNTLREDGIEITINSKKHKIYFITSLIVGDNLGLNSLFGFVESFTSATFCRICYATSSTTKVLCEENESLLRTVEKYEEDIKNETNTSITGIKKECVFNKLRDFHVIKSQTADVMHDLFEGVCNYVMSKILMTLTFEEKIFSIDYLNYQLRTINFDFESSNIPPPISTDYLKNNNKLKMSATEMLFFTRYFGILVGNQVPEDNKAWKLYKKLRSIVNIITSPKFTKSHLLQLKILISEHHHLYIKLYGDLKPKFHLLTHYVRLMENIGPLIKMSSMPFESKHRQIKMIAQASSSHVNILKTISIRYQLSIMHFQTLKYKNMYITLGNSRLDENHSIHFLPTTVKYQVHSVSVNDVTYKKGTIIVSAIHDILPEFGKIETVYFVHDTVVFIYTPLKVIGFNKHYFAYSVHLNGESEKKINYESLIIRTPCLLHENDGTLFIATRHIL